MRKYVKSRSEAVALPGSWVSACHPEDTRPSIGRMGSEKDVTAPDASTLNGAAAPAESAPQVTEPELRELNAIATRLTAEKVLLADTRLAYSAQKVEFLRKLEADYTEAERIQMERIAAVGDQFVTRSANILAAHKLTGPWEIDLATGILKSRKPVAALAPPTN